MIGVGDEGAVVRLVDDPVTVPIRRRNLPWISGDGSFVVFESHATNLVANDTNGARDIFIHQLATGDTRCISVDATGAPADEESSYASISDDGGWVAFHSAANLDGGDTQGEVNTWLWERATGEVTRVSVTSTGAPANGASWSTTGISAEGRWVVFSSGASNLVATDTNAARDIFLFDRESGSARRVVESPEANNGSTAPFISNDGRVVVFASQATNLVLGDTFNEDVFAVSLEAIP